MGLSNFGWVNDPSTSTPLDAAELEAFGQHIGAYVDEQVAGVTPPDSVVQTDDASAAPEWDHTNTPGGVFLDEATGKLVTGATVTIPDDATVGERAYTDGDGSVTFGFGPVFTVTAGATLAINTDLGTIAEVTGLSTAVTGVTLTGTRKPYQPLLLSITDNGTGRALDLGSSFIATVGSGLTIPTTTTASERLLLAFVWNAVTSKMIFAGAA